MLRATLNAPRRLGRRLRFFADDADPTELPQKPPPVCVPRAARRAYADKLAEQRRGWVAAVERERAEKRAEETAARERREAARRDKKAAREARAAAARERKERGKHRRAKHRRERGHGQQ